MKLGNCVDDPVVRATAAQIPAHALTELIAAERNRLAAQVICDMARHAALELVEHADRRAELPRGAISALKTVVVDKTLLERMQNAITREAFDRADRAALVLSG